MEKNISTSIYMGLIADINCSDCPLYHLGASPYRAHSTHVRNVDLKVAIIVWLFGYFKIVLLTVHCSTDNCPSTITVHHGHLSLQPQR